MTVKAHGPSPVGMSGSPRAFAWREVAAVAGLAGALFLLRLERYEIGGDELYFVAAGHRRAFGYADQGPLVPLLAALSDTIAPGSLVALRLPAVAATVAAVVLSALIAREFGGGRGAQVLAALAYAATPAAVMQAAMLSTYALDATLTALLVWLLIRWVRTRRDHLLLLAGLVAALDFQVKWLSPVVWAGLAAAVALVGPRDMLRRPAWWLGCALFTLAAVPTLWWQHANGWPQLAMGAVVRAEQLSTSGGVAAMPWQVLLVTGPMGLLLLVGMWAGLRWERLRPYRFLVPVVLLGLIGILAAGLRPYFVVGALPGLFGAGAAYLAWRGAGSGIRAVGLAATGVAVTLTVLAVVALPLPESRLRPTDTYAQIDWRSRLFGPSGWDDLVAVTAEAHERLSAQESADLVIVTQSYWQAAGLEYFGRHLRLPAVYSPNRGYGYFGPPPDTAASVLYIGVEDPSTGLGVEFGDTDELARIDRPLGFPGVNRHVTVWLCRDPQLRWSTVWPGLRTLRLVDGTAN
ncbi:glycosyltransferase family 39 protein [Nocardia sp. 2]|uniref:Glycosyltransferase family 39 protein n=1 Tax=Nocardia acididurans TaxID=2802282 RepID=A0ABS1M220_9NOCA|nr:glycosyltransferase family 39 protein [Nocardia acididurans]MBL1074717.1 glycosyltransferase family 39 protein [Nocardia acididurans]